MDRMTNIEKEQENHWGAKGTLQKQVKEKGKAFAIQLQEADRLCTAAAVEKSVLLLKEVWVKTEKIVGLKGKTDWEKTHLLSAQQKMYAIVLKLQVVSTKKVRSKHWNTPQTKGGNKEDRTRNQEAIRNFFADTGVGEREQHPPRRIGYGIGEVEVGVRGDASVENVI